MENSLRYCSAFNSDSSETIAYNNPLFPAYVHYGILSCYPDYSAISHWHEDLEFILIKKGHMTYNVNGNLIELYENHGIMVNSRQIHYGFSSTHEECEFICIILSPELLRGNQWFYHNYIEAIMDNFSYPYLSLGHSGWQGELLETIQKIYDVFGEKQNDSPDVSIPYSEKNNSPTNRELSYFKLIEYFCSIMKILYENLSFSKDVTQKESSELSSLKEMITYVEEHFTEPVTLENLALAGTCCKSRCSLLFKKYLRDTPISYITKFRLQKSLTALLESDLPITDIAFEYGFNGVSYYCETFRKYYGVSPLQYKKAQKDL